MNYSKSEGKKLDAIEQLKEQQRELKRRHAEGEQKKPSQNERLIAEAVRASEERYKSYNAGIEKLIQQQLEIRERLAAGEQNNPLENDRQEIRKVTLENDPVKRLEEYQSEMIRDLESVHALLEQQTEIIKRLISKIQR
ncbi:hypothetical protein QNH48_10105 [Neobacillus sp. YX16]|uniref:hypothetical protein n=1 Tax=Neobacillus sp. YX16 TaxID=3047874 RepID=UPI0024C23387|nr:hypothetical protein [Neobacillus sp. YX16]WHZ04942.1 hypothetical protein QNH48_10105 [Neobacillus sp. YX16]